MMDCVALLPIKRNSVRVPGKNFRKIAGKPLFSWILETLLITDRVSRVVINTDAAEQIRLAVDEIPDKVLIRDRRADLCGDTVSMNKIIADDIGAVDATTYLMTHATNPLLTPRTIDEALVAFHKAKSAGAADSLFSVTQMQTRFYDEKGKALNHDPSNLVPTQDLPPWFEENSNLYVFTRDSFFSTNARIGQKPLMFPMARADAIDIDDEESWKMAEALLIARERR